MNKRYKINGKAIKWIDSRFSKKEKLRRSFRMIVAAQINAATASQLNLIKLSSQSKVNKALGISKAILNGQIAMVEALRAYG